MNVSVTARGRNRSARARTCSAIGCGGGQDGGAARERASARGAAAARAQEVPRARTMSLATALARMLLLGVAQGEALAVDLLEDELRHALDAAHRHVHAVRGRAHGPEPLAPLAGGDGRHRDARELSLHAQLGVRHVHVHELRAAEWHERKGGRRRNRVSAVRGSRQRL